MGKTRTPYAPKVLKKGCHAKKENFSLAESHYTRAGHLLFLKLSSQGAFVRWAFLF